MVDRALKAVGPSRLNFVPTHYYSESSEGDVEGYCYMDGSYSKCQPFDKVHAGEMLFISFNGTIDISMSATHTGQTGSFQLV